MTITGFYTCSIFYKNDVSQYRFIDNIELVENIRSGADKQLKQVLDTKMKNRYQSENTNLSILDINGEKFVNMFSLKKDWEGILKMEVVEDTETAFELKVTECIQAACFIKHDSADIGYANVCWGDYAWAEGFNPKIKLVRDKTLMEGDSYCNHRYIWTG